MIHSSRSRSSSLDSGEVSALYSYSKASKLSLQEIFAVDTKSIEVSKKCYKHPVAVVLAKDSNSNPVVMKTLIDSYCTGKGLVALKTAKTLGLNIPPATHHETFTTVGGKFKTIGYATVPSVMLPVLSQDKTN